MDDGDFQQGLKSLPSISPTRFSGLKACGLREVWKASGRRPLLPQSAKVRVGLITHRLLAEAGRGHLEPDKARIAARWQQLLDETEHELSTSPTEAHLLPFSRSVRDLDVRRARAVNRTFEIAQATSRFPPEAVGEPSATRYGYELPVWSADRKVRGVIDAAISTSRGPLIRDYKSGAIFEPTEDGTGKIKEAYQVQLKMYAALYAETFGEWPTRLEVTPLTGEPHEIPFQKTECSALVSEAAALLARVNATIEKERQEALPALLAKPSPESCAFCPYRPACMEYSKASRDSREGDWPLDVAGAVVEVKRLGNSKILLRMQAEGGVVNIPGLTPGERHPALARLEPGDHVAVFNLRKAGASESYQETLMTTIYELDPGRAVIC